MRPVLAFVAILAASAQAEAQATRPSARMIAAIESGVKLPTRARPIESYVRYYAFETVELGKTKRTFVRGLFVIAGLEMGSQNRRPGAYGVRDLPRNPIMDGGCNVMHVVYDLGARKISDIVCNGMA